VERTRTGLGAGAAAAAATTATRVISTTAVNMTLFPSSDSGLGDDNSGKTRFSHRQTEVSVPG
jgi:hypothetical protein